MDKLEMLKSMVTHMINDKPEEASLDLHTYLADKMRDVAGLNRAPAENPDDAALQAELDTLPPTLNADEQPET